MKCQDCTGQGLGGEITSRVRNRKQQTGDKLNLIQKARPWKPLGVMLGGGSESPRAGCGRDPLRVQRPSAGLGTRGAANRLKTGA